MYRVGGHRDSAFLAPPAGHALGVLEQDPHAGQAVANFVRSGEIAGRPCCVTLFDERLDLGVSRIARACSKPVFRRRLQQPDYLGVGQQFTGGSLRVGSATPLDWANGYLYVGQGAQFRCSNCAGPQMPGTGGDCLL